MMQLAMLGATIWLVLSVWSETGALQDGIWAGLLPGVYFMLVYMLASSSPNFHQDHDQR